MTNPIYLPAEVRELLERVAKPVLFKSHEDAHADACAELRALLAQPAEQPTQHNAQPEVAKNTGSQSTAIKLQCRGMAVGAEVEGAATSDDASCSSVIECEYPACGCADAYCKAWPDEAEQPSAAKVPEGWQMVPMEPTEAMITAAEEAYMPFGDMDIALRMAMLAAAPRPAAEQGEVKP